MDELSPEYHKALEEARAHHASSKTYSGKFLRPHAPFIRELICRLRAGSVLDYGCGKGAQYTWVSHGGDASIPEGQTIEHYWGVKVTKYDPAYPPFALEPVGKFDLVICTHVLGSIPIADLPVIVRRIFNYAREAVYFAEKIGEVRKQVFSEPDKFPRNWNAEIWARFLSTFAGEFPEIEAHLATRTATDNGIQVKRVRLWP